MKKLRKLENLQNVEKIDVKKEVRGGAAAPDATADTYTLTIVVVLAYTEVEDIIIIY